MKSKDYSVTIELEKPATDVFRAITADVAKWWGGKDLSGPSTAPGDEFVVHHPGSHYSKQKITEWVPDKKLVWRVTESELDWLNDKSEWTNTQMVFEILEDGRTTLLRFTHQGLVPEKECYARCSEQGWGIVIKQWLAYFINKGAAHFL